MRRIETISLETARELIDFGAAGRGAIDAALAEDQLAGAIALHNTLADSGFAYLADEVGMGKTYVALGVVALLRYFNPGVRILYIAPRWNIQQKWRKELRNFTTSNWRHTDLRVRSFQGKPAVDTVLCETLLDWADQAVRNAGRDFLVRLTSFSFGLGKDRAEWKTKRERLREIAPILDPDVEDLRHHDKRRFKDGYARTINTLLPHYDLVVLDEAHNLKHGRDSDTTRNRLVELVLGTAEEKTDLPGFGRRFDRLLLLSATPLESDYRELWRQLDLFGFGGPVRQLQDREVSQQVQQQVAASFLVRRMTSLTIAGEAHTKNMYRLEWRGGGCRIHDEPLEIPDTRQRLIVALVQKKVAEVLRDPRFNASFQIGMLASFESFLETARVKADEEDEEPSNFDQVEQTQNEAEREGIDTPAINRLAGSYRRRFGEPLPHPKMDSVVKALAGSFATGEKALVFVRRIRSVTELAEKLCREYDRWLLGSLRERFPKLHPDLDRIAADYNRERLGRSFELPNQERDEAKEDADAGGRDSFFSWFFRGDGPGGYLSGAAFRKNRLQSEGSAYSTFFEDNYVADLLGARPGAFRALAEALDLPRSGLAARLRALGWARLAESDRKRQPRLRVFRAYQEAALHLLAESSTKYREPARILLQEVYGGQPIPSSREGLGELLDPEALLETPTFFTELRERPVLRDRLWPQASGGDFRERLRDRERRRELLAAVARLGHAFIDLWALAVARIDSVDLRAQERTEERAESLIADFLGLLEDQSRQPGALNAWSELSQVGDHHDLIHRVNFPEALQAPLSELARLYARSLRAQTPVGGMHGGVNSILVRQFRMPGYPVVLITTDVLQEGEDLHTFCSRIVHYGISWTPSSMEQRTGRIDRVGSLVSRRLANLERRAHSEELLQVYYPYLADTIERLQVHRVFSRLNRFTRLLHRSFGSETYPSRIDTRMEFAHSLEEISPIRDRLESAFPVRPERLRGNRRLQADPGEPVSRLLDHLNRVIRQVESRVRLEWDPAPPAGELYGTVFLEKGRLLPPDDRRPVGERIRRQPFKLYLKTGLHQSLAFLHGISPVGRVPRWPRFAVELVDLQRELDRAKICEVPDRDAHTYTIAVEGDLLFDSVLTQAEEVEDLITRICGGADRLEAWRLARDAALDEFRDDLRKEPLRASD